MIKRPLCLVSVFILCVQLVLAGVFQIAKDLKASCLEQTFEDGTNVTLQGRVYRREEKPEYQIYYLTDIQVRLRQQVKENRNILVYVEMQESEEQNVSVAVGNVIHATGELRFFQKGTNPGSFNQKFYYQKQGIHASLWCKNVKVTEPKRDEIKEWLAVLRARWKAFLVQSLGKTEGNSMSAILLGDKSELDSDMKKLYQKSGIGHILAISGLHMSFIGISLYKLLRRCGVGFAPAGLAGIFLLGMYTLMIGAGVSSLRAMIMYVVRMGAEIAGRDYDILTSLAVAAAAIALWQPLYLFDAGFQLSFGAILAIAAVAPVLEKVWRMPSVLSGGISIQILLLPIMLYYYFEVPGWSILLNLFVIPMMTLLLGAGLLGSIAALFWLHGGVGVLQVCKWILHFYEQICSLTMRLPFGRMVLGQPPEICIFLYYLLIFGICFYWNSDRKETKNGSRNLFGVCMATILLLCIGTVCAHGKSGELRVTAIDVGQGDAFYVRTAHGQHWLIDGGSSDVSKVGSYRIEPFLASQGVRSLDYVFVSHGDDDHMNGVDEMLQNQELGIQIAVLVLPQRSVLDEKLLGLAATAKKNGTKVVTIQQGDVIRENREKSKGNEFQMLCLGPAHDYEGEKGNAASMILQIKYREFDMLFTGDVEGAGEQELIQSGYLRDIDVLKVAHHGSKNSTFDEFLSLVKPEISWISAGKENRYGHPHRETLVRLKEYGSRLYSTQDCGAISLVSDGKKMKIKSFAK